MNNKKVVLIAVVGMSPAVVTESIWGLHIEHPELVPDEVKIYTTRSAWTNLEGTLLDRQNGESVWEELQQKIGKEMVLKKHIFENKQGGELDDIITPKDQELVADQLLRGIREYKNPQQEVCHIVASIAGGRKSMSALMYGAMSLGAEADDIITHILADEVTSACRNFFFPEQKNQHLEAVINGKKKKFTAADATLDLAEIPFVPLSALVKNSEFDANGSFNKLVGRAKQTIANPAPEETNIRISKSACKVYINGEALLLKAAPYSLLTILASAKMLKLPLPLTSESCYDILHALKENNKLPEAIVKKMIENERLAQIPANVREKQLEVFFVKSEWKNGYPSTFSKVKTYLKQALEAGGFGAVSDDCLGNLRKGESLGFDRISNIKYKD